MAHTHSIDARNLDALMGRAISDLSAGYGGIMISLGHQLGLFRAMAGAGPLTARELARRADCAERYVLEWLNSQAAGGYLDYHPGSDTFEMTPEQELVLADEESPVFLPLAWSVPASMWADEQKAIEAFRTGRGIAWGDHDGRLACGVAAFYRNGYKASLVPQWLPALEGVVEKLVAGAVVADVGCGFGHSTALMAKAFPASQFHGFDSHEASLEEAREVASGEGVATQCRFEAARADDYPIRGYDLICFFDALHDLGDPLAAASHAARALAPGGTVMLVEPFANDRLEDNISTVGRMYYAASTTICCAHAISDGGRLVLGAQAGEKRLSEVFRKAGFRHFRRAFETPFNLVLEARL